MLVALLGVVVIFLALLDAFEAAVLPRRIARKIRPTRMFIRGGWALCQAVARAFPPGHYRENTLSVFGPLAMLALLTVWAQLLVLGFAFISWGFELPLADDHHRGEFFEYWYLSGVTFFTLGYGDITLTSLPGRLLSVFEAGLGFGFLAVIIGYLPVLYQAFSRREQTIALLDARAGSPPTAGEALRRLKRNDRADEINQYLAEWESWSANLLESHLSFPVLSYYRSQHDNQSWLAALATILDMSALLLVRGDPRDRHRAELTFAMARHACVDLCLVFLQPPRQPPEARLTREEFDELAADALPEGEARDGAWQKLLELRELYEPFLQALADYFWLRLPHTVPRGPVVDNWQTSRWTQRTPGIHDLLKSDHFG